MMLPNVCFIAGDDMMDLQMIAQLPLSIKFVVADCARKLVGVFRLLLFVNFSDVPRKVVAFFEEFLTERACERAL